MSKKAAKAGIIGAVLGAIAGVFVLAPKGAKENRQDAKDAALRSKASLERKLKELYSEVNDLGKKVKSGASSLKGKAKDESKDLLSQTDKVKGKLKELISNVRDDASDVADEVEQTVSEVNSLIKKLKTLAKEEAKAARKK